MSQSDEDRARVEVAQQAANFRLRIRPFPPVHNRSPKEHQATADLFSEYATKWLGMLARLDDDGWQHVLYTLLWCAKDIAHPYSDRVWEELEIDPEFLRTELERIVRYNMQYGADKDAATAFATKCRGVGVNLKDH